MVTSSPVFMVPNKAVGGLILNVVILNFTEPVKLMVLPFTVAFIGKVIALV